MKSGVLAGYPVVDVKVTLWDGSYHEVDSSEMAFSIAGSMAFKDAMRKADPIITEPIMKVAVIVPDEYLGDVIGDLNARRGQIQGMEAMAGTQRVNAFVPLAQMFGYATDLRSKTQGRGQYVMEPSHYEPVPKNIADQIIDGKTPVHPYMGATLSSVNALNARTNKLSTDSGAYVASVVEDGPAAKAGIQEGDVITKLGDDEITSADGLIIALRSHEVGEKVEITLMRGKEEKKVTVELGSDEELQNQQQNDSATDTGNGGITDEQLRQYLEELLGQQGQGQGYGQGF